MQNASGNAQMSSTVNNDEIQKFDKIASEWWDPNGKFKPLHQINPVRIEYITNMITKYLKKEVNGLNIIDIGCGGGLVAEPFARLGANVTGIDAGFSNIEVAKLHAKAENLSINYIQTNIEDLSQDTRYDIVLALEIIEHVNNPELFINSCIKILNPGGMIVLSTLNRTIKSYLGAIIAAEHILKWLPKGTHEWKKFFTPAEIIDILSKNNCNTREITGLQYNLFKNNWKIGNDISINYFITAAM